MGPWRAEIAGEGAAVRDPLLAGRGRFEELPAGRQFATHRASLAVAWARSAPSMRVWVARTQPRQPREACRGNGAA